MNKKAQHNSTTRRRNHSREWREGEREGGMEDSKLGRGMDGTSQSKERHIGMKREIAGSQKEPSKRRENNVTPFRRVTSTHRAEEIQQVPTC